jgi:hypothetical protein
MKGAASLAVLAALLTAAPALAQEPAPPAKASDSVTFLTTLVEPGTISARFRGNLMYVSAESGLAIYDVADPAKPTEIGRLNLPNFENEDIDLGGDIALISNDPSEGLGRLHVISIKDPAAPALITSFDTGTADGGIFTGPIGGPFGVGKGTGHTASCVQQCRFVYLAGTGSGIDIVDLRDPEDPKYAGNFPAPEATGGLTTHDVQFDREGNAWISGAGGVAAYDVADPLAPKLLFRTDEQGQSRYAETFGTDDGSTLNDFIHHNSMRLERSNIAAATGDPSGDSDVVAITEEDYNRPTCAGAGSFHTWEITNDKAADGKTRLIRNLDRWDVEIDPSRQSLCSAHYFDARGGLVAQGWYEQGTRFLDVSDPRDIRQVGFWIPNKTLTWGALYPPTDPAGEIVYALDNARGIDVLRFDRPEPGQRLETVVAPPGDAPDQTTSPSGGPSPSSGSIRPNVALRVSDSLSRVRRVQRARYAVTAKHIVGPAARDLRVEISVPRGLLRRRGTRLVKRQATLGPGQSRTWRFTTRVPRRSKLRNVVVRARLSAADDANPRDDYAVDRTKVTGRRAARRRGRAASDHVLAQNMALLPTVRAPRNSGRARQIPAQRSAYGWVCRVR